MRACLFVVMALLFLADITLSVSSFEQIESYYQMKLPDDVQGWHDKLTRSGLLAPKNGYLRLLGPGEIVEAKLGVMTPDLIPVMKDNFGNAIGWRECRQDVAGGGWYWYDHEENVLGSLGPTFRGMLRAAALYIVGEASEAILDGDALPVDPEEQLAVARAIFLLPGLFGQPDQATRSLKIVERYDLAEHPYVLHEWMEVLGQDVAVPLFLESKALEKWRRGRTQPAAEVWREALAVDRTSCLLHWHLGVTAAVANDSRAAIAHFARAFEGTWDNYYNIFSNFPCRECTDIDALASYLRSAPDEYARVSKFPELRQILLSGETDNIESWRDTIAACLRSSNLEGARTLAINGLCPSRWPGKQWRDKAYTDICMATLVEVYRRRGLETRVAALMIQ